MTTQQADKSPAVCEGDPPPEDELHGLWEYELLALGQKKKVSFCVSGDSCWVFGGRGALRKGWTRESVWRSY